jgi:hypothetical protein
MPRRNRLALLPGPLYRPRRIDHEGQTGTWPRVPPKTLRPNRQRPRSLPRPSLPSPTSTPGGQVKLKDLIESVAAKTGGKKPEVKAAVEATLAALGEALATGKALVVPPLGKLRVVKNKGPALTLKLRLADGAKAAGLALADDGEDG